MSSRVACSAGLACKVVQVANVLFEASSGAEERPPSAFIPPLLQRQGFQKG